MAAGTGLLFSAPGLSQQASALTAGQILDRIRANVGVPWREQTVDKIIAGSADTAVKGIATTMMATLDVLQRALAAGKNMVITHESTFFSHQDTIDQLQKDETYLFKREFVEKNGMVVFHFHDHWHAHKPDGIATGMIHDLGWEKNVDAENPRIFNFPATPLAQFAQDIERKLQIRTMRVLGDPNLPVKRVSAGWGYVSQFPGIPIAGRAETDLIIVGETREWELVEYVQDMITSGKKKALIILGHVVSEQAGMKNCADWLKTFIPEVPVQFVAANEPFWFPGRPVSIDKQR